MDNADHVELVLKDNAGHAELKVKDHESRVNFSLKNKKCGQVCSKTAEFISTMFNTSGYINPVHLSLKVVKV